MQVDPANPPPCEQINIPINTCELWAQTPGSYPLTVTISVTGFPVCAGIDNNLVATMPIEILSDGFIQWRDVIHFPTYDIDVKAFMSCNNGLIQFNAFIGGNGAAGEWFIFENAIASNGGRNVHLRGPPTAIAGWCYPSYGLIALDGDA
jgi:hypothetical protein